ncbi:MAG: diacylglycerol/polyprenol kinase family protein [Pseudomonadota bacterium]
MLTTLEFETKRKIFHISSAIIPIIYIFMPKLWMVMILTLVAFGTSAIDTTRHYHPKIQALVDKFLLQFMREREKNGSFVISGASYMMSGFFLTTLLFPKGVAIASMFVLIVSDAAAAIVGTRVGKPLENGKSIAGSAAFFMSAILISTLSYSFAHYKTNFLIIILASLITTAVEYYTSFIKIDDNLTIPLAFASSIILLGLF